MKQISDIDVNFKVGESLKRQDLQFRCCTEPPFQVYGVFRENGKFRRLPEVVAASVSEGVHALHAHTAGGRVRFATDSNCVAISAEMGSLGKMPHFAFTGSMGFDLYADDRYVKTFVPPCDMTTGYESVIEFETKEFREITINFPLYSEVKELYIGLPENADVKAASPYRNEKPVVYYGSSITQGGCASRPGMSYQSMISRRFHCDYVNLGFSGSAKAEEEIVAYLEQLEMSLFVYDYDHNAPTVEHLQNTHETMFQAIRKTHPDIPIILMSRPKFQLNEEETERRRIIETTYQHAVLAGDDHVYFLDGEALTELCGNEGTVDGCHPTDFGFASMAKTLGDVMEQNQLMEAI